MHLFIVFTDGGGFYDHVPPPTSCGDRLGFRVPLIVVSPRARRGFVSHVTYDHTSVTRFVEARFGVPARSARDANADPLLGLFDFVSPPSPAMALPASALDSDELDRCVDEYP